MLWVKALVIAGSVIVGLGSVYLFKMKPDNVVEQVAEEVIKDQTGLTIDLTPEDIDTKTPAGNDKPAGVATDEKKKQ